VDAADTVTIREPKYGLRRVVRDLTAHAADVLVEGPTHVVVVAEQQRLLRIKTNGDDVLRILLVENAICLLNRQRVLEQKFLVIGHLDYERHIKHIL